MYNIEDIIDQFNVPNFYLWPKSVAKRARHSQVYSIENRDIHVGLACAIPPTNTNFQLSFLLTQLQEALYEDLPV